MYYCYYSIYQTEDIIEFNNYINKLRYAIIFTNFCFFLNMGDLPKYNATVHPEEWVKRVQAICLLNNLRQEKDVLKMCKLNIALSISFPNDINTLNELTKALKAHTTYE